MLSAYWGFVLMSLHLGLHWSIITASARRALSRFSWLIRILAVAVALCGVAAFIRRDIGSYMLLKTQFVFFDFDEPLMFFILDYAAVMALFVFVGHYIAKALRLCVRKK